jgi:DNA-nicking Smr family endonuclease
MKTKRPGQTSEGTGKRVVTADEAELWQFATRSLDPVKTKPRVGRGREGAGSSARAAQQAVGHPAPARRGEPPMARPPGAVRTEAPKPRGAPPLAQFDRRKARQIAAGKVEVDALIDLHGLDQREAHSRLLGFLVGAHARGEKCVLVITGKGREPLDGELGSERRGVLRRAVPRWLEEPQFRAMVSSFTPAGVRHGGAGALYLRMRRGR